MLRVLQRTTRGMPVEPVQARFEEFRTSRRFDLVYAAAAWHWVDPAFGWTRAVELLAPGGVLALFGSPAEPHDPDLHAAVEAIEREVLPGDDPDVVHPWSLEDMTAAEGLVDCVQRDVPRVLTTTSADFLRRLSTVSAYLMLSAGARADALRRVAAVLPERFDLDATIQLSLARRA